MYGPLIVLNKITVKTPIYSILRTCQSGVGSLTSGVGPAAEPEPMLKSVTGRTELMLLTKVFAEELLRFGQRCELCTMSKTRYMCLPFNWQHGQVRSEHNDLWLMY